MSHPESKIQIACVRWFRLQYPQLVRNLFAVPNGAFLQGSPAERKKQWNRLSQEGAIPGVADLFLAAGNDHFHGLFIEMKTPTGKLSDNQIEFRRAVTLQNYAYVVCHGFEAFSTAINNYLSQSTNQPTQKP